MLKVIIAEDDPAMRLILRRVIEEISGLEIVAEAEDGAQLVYLADELMPDVVFLDISMPIMSGIEAARKIFAINPDTSIVFVTAYDNYTHEAFEVYAFDYLVKPFNLDRIRQTIARIKEVKAKGRESGNYAANVQDRPHKLALKSSDRQVLVSIQDIIFITRSDRQTIINTTKGTATTYEPLQSLYEKLKGDNFFRCHKGYVINVDMVEQILPWGKKAYLVKFAYTSETALMTRERAKEFQERYC